MFFNLFNRLFCFIWNTLLIVINNSVRVGLSNDGNLIVKDNSQIIEIAHKKRFEFYLQNINTRLNHISYEYMLDSIKISFGDIVIDCGANMKGTLFSN